MLRPLAAVALAALLASPALAQKAKDDAEAIKKQKQAAADNLKQVKITKPVLVETDNLLVYSELAEEKLKPIAEAAQKAYEQGYKDLRYGEKDRLWGGKLTVYVLADRPKEYTPFVKLVEQRSGKLDADEMETHTTMGEPYVAVTAAPGTRTPEADLKAEAMAGVGAALVDQKMGVAAPSWLHSGVGKAIALHAEGNGKALDAYRAKTKAVFTRARVGTFKVSDVWGDTRVKDADTLTVSLGEYLVYGADAAAADKFFGGFRPTEDRRDPNVNTALEAAEWKVDALDAAWKTWVFKQK
jgi:hypothetical protein